MTPLSKGADFSSCGALQSHFRRLFERFNERDDQFERRGAIAIKALKQVGDDDDTPELHDDYVWIALAERLHRRYDYSRRDLDWMFACVEVCCPSCFSMLKWQKRPDGRVLGRCSEHCQGVQVYVTYRIREIIRSGYNRAFTRGSNEDAIGELLVLQAPETKSESDGERARA